MPTDTVGQYDGVNKPSETYTSMAERWSMIDDLLGGTARMRRAGKKWLPRESAESDESYAERLNRSYLYGALKDTVEKFVAKPFSRRIRVKGQEALSPELQAIEANADMLGTSLTDFGRNIFRDGVAHGLSFLFVDYSKTATVAQDGSVVTPNKSEEKAMGARPYFQHFHSSDVIGVQARREPNGALVPTQVRVRETRTEVDGLFGEKKREYVRVYSETQYQEFRKGDDGGWTALPAVPSVLAGINIIPFYVAQDGFFSACPPFEDLGWENVAHWQSSSDQNAILHFARVPILHWTGLTTEDDEKKIEIGPNRILKSQNTGSKLEYVEPTGAAIESGHKDIQAREARMEVLGLSPAMERVQDQTAEARKIDDSNARSSIQSWIRGLERAIEMGYEIAAKLLKQELPKDFGISIFQDFGIGQRAQQDIVALQAARTAGDIDHETFLYELKKRGVLDESTDIEKVIQKTKDEGPSLPDMTSFGAPPGSTPPPQAPPPPPKTTNGAPPKETQPTAQAA